MSMLQSVAKHPNSKDQIWLRAFLSHEVFIYLLMQLQVSRVCGQIVHTELEGTAISFTQYAQPSTE